MLKTSVVVAAFGQGALAFVPSSPFWGVARDARSVAVEAKASSGQSVFERRKANYKGPVAQFSDADSDFSYAEFDSFLEKQTYTFGRGQVVKGTVVQFEYQGALVDIGSKSAAFMPLKECSLLGATSVGDTVDIDEVRDFQIISDEDENGQLLVSIKRLEYAQAWEKVAAMQVEDKAFDGEVTAVNRGGCIVIVHGLRAFLPGSHLCGALPTEDLIGKSFRLKLLEVNQEGSKIVVSNRRAVVEDSMTEIARGDVVEGIVKSIKPYGAFVEIMGVSGLLHISQISYDRIEDLSTVLQPNQAVKCMIIDHDKVNGRIALSTKTLEPEPGDMIKNPSLVYDMAEKTAAKYHERMEAERKAREEAAKDIVMGLGDLDAPFAAGSDLEQILNPPAAAE